MDDALKIECEWWGRANGEKDISQVSRGAIGISVGDQWLTRLEDSWGNTVRNRLHASAYTLAGWLAGNWWRLRWEPETPTSRSDVDWRMSHSMASAGDGYCWPSILFASDGDTLAVASRATRGRVLGPVRYLNEVNTRITGKAFESGRDVATEASGPDGEAKHLPDGLHHLGLGYVLGRGDDHRSRRSEVLGWCLHRTSSLYMRCRHNGWLSK